jgi:predicted HTH domain antitoxin
MTITVHVTDALLEGLGESPEEIGRQARLAMAIHLYGRGLISQGGGAELAGLNRREFIEALGRAGVPACQVTAGELEVERAYQAHRQRVAAHPLDQDRKD